jgi:hypothetical protein
MHRNYLSNMYVNSFRLHELYLSFWLLGNNNNFFWCLISFSFVIFFIILFNLIVINNLSVMNLVGK